MRKIAVSTSNQNHCAVYDYVNVSLKDVYIPKKNYHYRD